MKRINEQNSKAKHLPKFDEIIAHLRAEARDGDLIVTMGAGNVWEIGRDLVG